MAARIVFLGTGGALNLERFQASILVDAGDVRVLLDTGGGLELVRKMRAAGIDPPSVGHVFVSHRHLDHSGGLEPLLLRVGIGARIAGTPPPTMRLYATPTTMRAVRDGLAALDGSGEHRFGDRLQWIALSDGESAELAGGCRLRLVEVDHLPPSGGAAGCVLSLHGARVAYSGDTLATAHFEEAVRGVDLLLHEVGGLDANADLVHTPHHATAGDVGRLAARAGVRAVGLVHVPSPAGKGSADALLEEVRRYAPGIDVFCPEDGEVREVSAARP